jgi:hypothetical protein
MTNTLLKKARKVKDLRVLQRRLATTGHHNDALELRAKIQPHRQKVILAYLGVKELPETVNAVLVGEIAEVAATMATPEETKTLCSRLRRAAWNDQVETTRTLFHAKALLPNLQKVEAALSIVKE